MASHGLLNDTQSRAWHELISRIAGTAALDVLDVGCGTGFLSLLLAGGFVIGAASWKQSESPKKQLAAEIWGHMAAENAKSCAVLHQVWCKLGGRNGSRAA